MGDVVPFRRPRAALAPRAPSLPALGMSILIVTALWALSLWLVAYDPIDGGES